MFINGYYIYTILNTKIVKDDRASGRRTDRFIKDKLVDTVKLFYNDLIFH